MPFGVTRWPHATDIRNASFAIVGFDSTGTPPWKLRASSVGALAPYDMFDGAGVVIDPSIILPGETHWQYNGSLTTFNIELIVYGFSELQALPVPHSLQRSLGIGGTAAPVHQANDFLTWPDPITGWTMMHPTPSGGGTNYFPNGLSLTPLKWDTPITP